MTAWILSQPTNDNQMSPAAGMKLPKLLESLLKFSLESQPFLRDMSASGPVALIISQFRRCGIAERIPF